MRIIAAFRKDKGISYTSHLDVQRTLQRAFRRAQLPLAYTKGYNPHPKLSFATALATGFSSDGEWIELELERDLDPAEFMRRANAVLPGGMQFHTAFADEDIDTLSKLLCCARYTISLHFDPPVGRERIEAALKDLLDSKEIIVQKKTKSGVKPTDIRPEISEAFVTDEPDQPVRIELLGSLTVSGGLRVETFLNALYDRLGESGFASVHRNSLYFTGTDRLPHLS